MGDLYQSRKGCECVCVCLCVCLHIFKPQMRGEGRWKLLSNPKTEKWVESLTLK